MTHWKVKGSVQEVSDVLGEPRDLVRWWPSVYLEVRQMEPGDARGIGKVVRLHTRGWLPYTLKWEFRVTESREPFGYSLEARGDFSGTGVWTFEPSGDSVEITYDWRVRAGPIRPSRRLLLLSGGLPFRGIWRRVERLV